MHMLPLPENRGRIKKKKKVLFISLKTFVRCYRE